MGFGDYTPPSSGRMKPVTKKQLQAIRAGFQNADKASADAKAYQAEEQIVAEQEIDDFL